MQEPFSLFPLDSESFWGSYFKHMKKRLCANWSLGAGAAGFGASPGFGAAHHFSVLTRLMLGVIFLFFCLEVIMVWLI